MSHERDLISINLDDAQLECMQSCRGYGFKVTLIIVVTSPITHLHLRVSSQL